jgi:hypothetical protein
MTTAMAAALAAAAAVAGDCAEAPAIAAAPVGLEIVYEQDGAVLNGIEIVSAEKHVSSAVEINFPPGEGAPFKSSIAEKRIFGVIPVAVDVASADRPEFNFSRHRAFDGDPAALLAGMKPGETKIIASRETFKERGMSFTEAAPVSATFLGCVTEDIAGRPERLLKYEIAVPTLLGDMEGKKAPALKTTVWTYGISERLGWVLKMEREGETVRARSVKEPPQ